MIAFVLIAKTPLLQSRRMPILPASALAKASHDASAWPPLFTIARAVAYTACSRSTINRAIQSGELLHHGRIGKHAHLRVVRREDLDRWLAGDISNGDTAPSRTHTTRAADVASPLLAFVQQLAEMDGDAAWLPKLAAGGHRRRPPTRRSRVSARAVPRGRPRTRSRWSHGCSPAVLACVSAFFSKARKMEPWRFQPPASPAHPGSL